MKTKLVRINNDPLMHFNFFLLPFPEKVVGDTILYFGCRHKEQDFLYQEELDEYCNSKTLTKLHVAFSRDTDKKVYVQHLLRENKEEVWRVIESGGHFYICG